jgi:outer membrane biosynthesis protein TonB
LGENPYGPEWSQIVSGTLTSAADVLLALQGENGCWPNLYGPGDDPYSTTDAIILLAQEPGQPFPIPTLLQAPILDPDSPEEPAEQPTEQPTEEPMEEPTAVPVEEPTVEPEPEPTEVPPTAVPEPTDAPVVAEAPAGIEAAPEMAQTSSTAPIIAVIAALLLVAGGAYWYLKK